MKKLTPVLFAMVFILLGACSSPAIVTTWKKYPQPLVHSRIMTVAVLKDHNDSLRHIMERTITRQLTELQYSAVSAIESFGRGGLSGLSEKATYLELCNKGIDAVLIIALVDNRRADQLIEKAPVSPRSYRYPDKYFYDRIWLYQSIQADITTADTSSKDYCWEAILFNLNTLEAECRVQSRPFNSWNEQSAYSFADLLVKKLVKEKVLERQKPRAQKAF